MLYDYEEKQVIYEKKIELFPFLDSFNLPQMNDRSNLCENDLNYQRKGASIKIKSKLRKDPTTDSESDDLCVTTIDFSIEGELNFSAWQTKNMKRDENFSDLRAIASDKNYFFFNQKSYLKPCGFTLDINQSLANPLADTSRRITNLANEETVYDPEIRTSWGDSALRYVTSDPKFDYSPKSNNQCMGVVDYGRGVFPYKVNWEWNFAQGTAEVESPDGTKRTEKIALNLAGGLAHPDHIAAGEDYMKIGSKVHLLYATELVYDELNFMNGFVFKTADKFSDKKTGKVHLVFTTNRDKMVSTNLLLVKVYYYYYKTY